jgi:hypothetical protein
VNVWIKSFDVDMTVKNSGIELEVREPNGGALLGDFIVTKTGLIWCKGRTRRSNGKKISWHELAAYLDSQ